VAGLELLLSGKLKTILAEKPTKVTRQLAIRFQRIVSGSII